jgi:hypothetical protein
VFGKPLSAYVAILKPVLILLIIVGLARLGASLLGLPVSTVRWLAMNAVVWGGAIYLGAVAYTRRFGSYRQLLPLMLIQMVVFQAIAVLGILLAIAGLQNIFAAPEYSFQAQSQWVHLLAHLTVGIVVPTLILWGVSSLVMWVTKKVARAPEVAGAEAR